ncbi:MAG: RNA polymerase sigma factor [bacterium]
MSTFQEIGSTDHNLLRSLSNIDERFAWVTFLARYRPMIHQCMLNSTLDANERDEIESQVMLRLVKFFSKPDAKINSSFRGFLAKIVENEIHEYLRAKLAYREVHCDYDSVGIAQFSLDETQRESIQDNVPIIVES